MKLVFAIVNVDDGGAVSNALINAGHFVTRLSSDGGFLKAGNNTFLICAEDSDVDSIVEIIKKYSRKRRQYIPLFSGDSSISQGGTMSPIEVPVGGATIFVSDIERFEKV